MRNVSATQVTTFVDCARKWYLRYVAGIKTPRTPQQELGSHVHKGIEHYLRTGEIAVDDRQAYVEAAKDFLPEPAQDGHLIEHKFILPTFKDGPPWVGYIDLGIDDEPPIVCDHKTTSDFRYAKTPAEMEEDTQLCSYAKWVQGEQQKSLGYSTGVIVQLLYLHTRRKTKAKRVKLVETVLTPEQVNAIWKRDLETVRQMVAAEQVKNVENLPPNTRACTKYGGCPYRKQCGLEIETNPGRGKRNAMSSFLERMKAKKAEAAAAKGGNSDPTEPAIPPEQAGVVPPDGASRTTPVPDEKPEAAPEAKPDKPKTRRGRPRMTEAEKEARKKERAAKKLLEKARKAQEEAEAAKKAAETPEPASEPEPEAAPTPEPAPEPAPEPVSPSEFTQPVGESAISVAQGFTLYVDCWPVKGNGAPAVLFDDWITSIIADINNEVDVADYRLLGFQQEKLALQAGLEKHLDKIPPVLIVSTSSSVAKDALQTLIPHAVQVIRAMR
jgi:hypothetical protein